MSDALERFVALTIHEAGGPYRICGRVGHHFGSARCDAFRLARQRITDEVARTYREVFSGITVEAAAALAATPAPDTGADTDHDEAYRRGYKDGRAAERWEQTHGEGQP
jgi:hypothetical protein